MTSSSSPKSNELSDKTLRKFAELVLKLTGIQMNEQKRALLENRLNKRLRALSLATYDQYYDYLTGPGVDPAEIVRFTDVVTTNETYFFRTPRVWEYFQKTFLPEWLKANQGATLQMWCGASSSGEEPYTIGILCEEFAASHPGFSWSLKASDISEEMLAHCQEATYSGRSIETVDPQRLKKFFKPGKDGAQTLIQDVRGKIKFFKHNLHDHPPLSKLDLVFLRNVMIYFDVPTKERLLTAMHGALKPGGTLIVGESEGLIGVKTPFKYLQPSIYRKEE